MTSGDHVMVVPNQPPASIDGGPEVSTHFADLCNRHFRQVRVNGRLVAMVTPWPDPTPVPNSPYEAYVLANWTTDTFAIRMRAGASAHDVA